jgi:hypothetical protein
MLQMARAPDASGLLGGDRILFHVSEMSQVAARKWRSDRVLTAGA